MNDTLKLLDQFQDKLLALVQSEQDRLGRITEDHALFRDAVFNEFALELSHLQQKANPHVSSWFEKSSINAKAFSHWKKIPGIPTQAFKLFDWSCIPESQRSKVFYSSGTTGKDASRHWHHERSLELYESLLSAWHREHTPGEDGVCRVTECLFLTPRKEEAPHSSLIHMFGTIADSLPSEVSSHFAGSVTSDNEWIFPLADTVDQLSKSKKPVCIFGTAFLLVHLLDHLEETEAQLSLPEGSVIFETGGYKGKSRSLTKEKLYKEIESKLGIAQKDILCEYGMSELSSQAYDTVFEPDSHSGSGHSTRRLRFPPWARCRVISPETALEVGYGEMGLIQVIDLANVWSSVSVLTEDIGVRHQEGFELLGRAQVSEPRGCSLMSDDFE
jgi:acyl-CoA synthetase (AMP-forming)/AMP-acid ligase II